MDRIPIPFADPIIKYMADDPQGVPCPAWGFFEGQVWFRCQCGKSARLSRHTIEENGDVNASILCANEGCTAPGGRYHVWGRLEGWTGGRRLPLE